MEPQKIYAGDSVAWEKTLADYPAADWSLAYELRGPGAYTVAASADGDVFSVEITKETTDAWIPGTYTLYGIITDGSERVTVYQGALEVKANPTEIAAGVDARGHARRTLDLIEAAIENYAANPYQSITIAGRTKSNWSLSELIQWREHFRAEARREEAAERLGDSSRRRVFVRFDGGE